MIENWITHFPGLAALPQTEQTLLVDRARAMQIPTATTVFAPGKPAENFLLLLSGTVRVQQVSPNGREIVLYRVSGGESCIMTTACLMSGDVYSAEGVTETIVDAIAIPKAAFDDALAASPGFRQLVFSEYSNRISDLMHVVEDVAFERLDKRLAQKLLNRVDSADTVFVTHQELANDLGTAREVVGRQLKELERRGAVQLSRGRIDLTDLDALSLLAQSE